MKYLHINFLFYRILRLLHHKSYLGYFQLLINGEYEKNFIVLQDLVLLFDSMGDQPCFVLVYLDCIHTSSFFFIFSNFDF